MPTVLFIILMNSLLKISASKTEYCSCVYLCIVFDILLENANKLH